MVGTSVDPQLGSDARTTISLANSMPVVCRPSARIGSRAEAAHAAVEVADGDREEQPADARQHRVAELAVQARHRARLDAALEAVAHDQVVARAQLVDEGLEVVEKS